VQRTDDAHGDLTPVCNEDTLEHRRSVGTARRRPGADGHDG
jgi:hypothetical protein